MKSDVSECEEAGSKLITKYTLYKIDLKLVNQPSIRLTCMS